MAAPRSARRRAASAPPGGQQPDHLVEPALEGRQGLRNRRDELGVAEDGPPHVRRVGVVLIELAQGCLQPERGIGLVPQRPDVGERVQLGEVG